MLLINSVVVKRKVYFIKLGYCDHYTITYNIHHEFPLEKFVLFSLQRSVCIYVVVVGPYSLSRTGSFS